MAGKGWSVGEEDQHGASGPGPFGLVLGIYWCQAVFGFVVSDDHCVQEVTVLTIPLCGSRLAIVETATSSLGHIMHQCKCAVWSHIVAAQESRHGVVDVMGSRERTAKGKDLGWETRRNYQISVDCQFHVMISYLNRSP